MSEEAPAAGKRGRKPALQEQHIECLKQIVAEQPHATLQEVADALAQCTGLRVSTPTVRKALRQSGFEKRKPARSTGTRAAEQGSAARYGYTAAHRRQDGRSGYNTDLTDAEWELVRDLFEQGQDGRGRPPKHSRRLMLDACCYVVRTGCPWRLLPKSFPPWQVVHKTFSRWAAAGLFEHMHHRLREQWRARQGRTPQPSALIIDSQSTRGGAQGGVSGFDAGKKVKGRKRHVVVDTLGLVLAVTITAASVQDRDAAAAVVGQALVVVPQAAKLYADSAYAGQCKQQLEAAHEQLHVQIVRSSANTGSWLDMQQRLFPQPPAPGFVVQAKRWVVERTHAWIERARRLVMHHDRSQWAPVAWVWLTEARLLAARLAA